MLLTTNYTLLALYATIFTWFVTLLGSSMVFFFKKINKNFMDASLGIAAGIMMSASFWSLLNPAIENAKNLNQISWLVVTTGFMLGGIFIFITDKIFQKKLNSKNKRLSLMILSITMHNIPEGLAVGIAFGSIKYGLNSATLTNSVMLALAIGLQNFPEGSAISLPLRREGYSRTKSFIYGSLSAIVEPIFGLIGALFSMTFDGDVASIGASGAIFGLMGALLYFGYHYRVYLGNVVKTQILPLIVFNLALGFILTGVDNFAHIGGLIGGTMITMALGVKDKSSTFEKVNGWIIALIFTVFIAYIAFIYSA
jgi:ZIP family zinc transporter